MRAYSHQAYDRPRCRRRATNLTRFHPLRVGNAEEQYRCLRQLARHESAEQSYMNEGIQILELARNAQKLFERQQAREKRRLLNFVLSNCTWEDGEVAARFRQPFDLFGTNRCHRNAIRG
jgi:hypothetical protein